MSVFTIVSIVIVSLIVLFSAVSCTRKTTLTTNPQPQVTSLAIRSMSQAEIEKMLRNIETQKAPEAKMGAMCYDMALPPDRVEYICPVCGEKTLYKKVPVPVIYAVWDIQDCRREFEILKKSTDLLLSMDESSFCKHCQPRAKKHELQLSITYADGKTHTTSHVTQFDLRLLRDFLKGKLSYETFTEGSEPLKDSAPRLRELLGIEMQENPEQK